jgi:PAS domain S-box-containing protein
MKIHRLSENGQENNPLEAKPTLIHRVLPLLLGALVLAALYGLSRENFLLFHGITELFSIAVAWSLFMLVWSSRRMSSNDALLFTGIAYGFIGLIDLIHTLAYKGMGVFPQGQDANTATQLWIAARGTEGMVLLLFPMLLGKRRLSGDYTFWGVAAWTAVLLCAIFLWEVFPACYIDGQGLTAFKKGAEYTICLGLFLAMTMLYIKRANMDTDVFRLMMAAMAITAAAELNFTFYISVYGISNAAGHLFKIISFYLVYLALVRVTVTAPHATIYRGLEEEKKHLTEEGQNIQLLQKVSSLFLDAETLDKIMEDLPRMIAAHYAVPIVAIEIYDQDRAEMIFAGTAGIDPSPVPPLRVPSDQSISGTVARTGNPFSGLDVRDHADYRAEALKSLDVVTFVCVPMHGNTGVIGTLAIADRKVRSDIADESNLLEIVAGQIGREIDRLRARTEIQVLLEHSPAIIFEIDRMGTILRMNKPPAGIGMGEVLGQSMYTFMNPDFHQNVAEIVNTVFETGKSADYEIAGIGPDRQESFYRSIIAAISDESGRTVSAVILSIDISDRKIMEEKIQESEQKYQALFAKNLDGYVINKGSGEIIEPNPAFARMLGYGLEEIKTVSFWDLTPEKWIEWERAVHGSKLLERGYTDLYEKEYIRKDGTVFPIEVQAFLLNNPAGLDDAVIGAFVRDITERKQIELEQEIVLRVLEILNTKTELQELMQSLVDFMQDLSGCEAVGIRLRNGEDFPYYETRGFSNAFVMAEKNLCARDLNDQLLRDAVGNPVLECMCGNIICGRFDPALPFFTEFGSFYSNSTTKLLASTTEADRQARTRNRCNAEGYESVMLVPLRSIGETFGLLQFNDRRENRFSPGFVSRVERMAGDVAMALAQRQADDKLKESLERLKGFDLHSTEGVYRIDMARPVPLNLAMDEMQEWINQHAVVGDVNESLAKMYSLSSKEMIGRPATDFAPDYGRRAMRVLESPDRRVINEETKDVDTDGHPLYLIENYHGIVEDGHLHAIWGAQRDITDRKLAESALEKEKLRLSQIIDSIRAGTWEWNVQTGETFFNERWAEIIGCSLDEISPVSIDTWRENVHPEDLKISDDLLAKHFNGERDHYVCEVRMKHRSGSWVWVLDSGRVVRWSDEGKPLMMMGTHQDISMRKAAEKNLWESRERLQKVFDSHIDAILILDAQVPPHILSCNKAVWKIFGYSVEEMQGKTTDHIHENASRLKEFQLLLSTAIKKDGFLKDFEFTMKRKNGSVFPSGHTVMPLTDDVGSKTGWLSIVSDLTDRKTMETRLQQAQKMESIGTLAGGIAHDFNNILFPIIGMSELLMEDLPRESMEYENAKEILKAGKRGRDLVQQILTFSRQTGQKMLPVRPQQILKEAAKLTRSTIPSDIKINSSLQPDCGQVLADPTQLHQIAMNLITNAYHAVQDNQGQISIKLKEADIGIHDLSGSHLKPGRYAVLTVSDTGPGIAPETLDKIFEPYFTTKKQGKGTGLGLSVVFGIVQEHDGEIRVETKVGKGTAFHVYLPLLRRKADSATVELPEILPTGSERILLVDDEVPVLTLEKQMLERLGYHVSDQKSSTSALEAFSKDPLAFDLVISDMAMPELPGDKLTVELLKIRPDIPVIICTGFSERIDTEKAEAIGAKALLFKPIIKSKIAQTVRSVLDDTWNNVTRRQDGV